MSDIATEPTGSAVTQTEGLSADSTPVGSESVEVSTETSGPTLNLDEYREYRVPVKVNGEESQVTLEELRRGYSREADYTRKSQELAAARQNLSRAEALYTAFQTDPQGTLRSIAEHYDMSISEAREVMAEAQEQVESDPVAERLATIEERFAMQEAAEVRSHIDTEFASLHETYGDFDDSEVIQHALQQNVSVTDAFKLLNFEKVRAEKERLAQEDAVLQAKRQASVVDGGKTRSGAVKSGAPMVSSVREAWAAAKQAH